MKFFKLGTQGLIALAVISSSQVMAGDEGWYMGFNIGKSRVDIDNQRISSSLLSQGFVTTDITNDDKDNGWKVFGGYQLNKYFALEGGYFDLGEYSFQANTLPVGTYSGNIRIKGINLDAVGILPITQKISAFGRLGLNAAKAEDVFSGTGGVHVLDPEHNKRDTNYKMGIGLAYAFTPSLALRAEAERYRIDDTMNNRGDVDLVSLGLVYRFGQQEATAVTEQPLEPEPVIVAEVVPVVVEPIATEQYCSILEMEFEIDNDTIQRQEKERLKTLGTFLSKYPETTATIEGHSDNVGDSEYNMQLSLRRAQSVVDYLKQDFGIASSRLKSVGYGSSRPIADNQTQEGKRSNRRIAAVISCATDIEGLNVAPTRMTMAMNIEFDHNSDTVKSQYAEDLRKVADFLKANPKTTATVEGHTGNIQATPELTMAISQRRAQSVVNYLVDNYGISRSRLTAEGFGRSRRFAYNNTAEGRQENRRVNIIINYSK